MKRLWADALGLALAWPVASCWAGDYVSPVSLGRPQALSAAGTVAVSGKPTIQQTAFQTPPPTIVVAPAGSSGFAAGDVWGTTPHRLTGKPSNGFAADVPPQRPVRSATIAVSVETQPEPLPVPRVMPTTPAPIPSAEPFVEAGVGLATPSCCDDWGCCDGFAGHGHSCCFFGSTEALLWWMKSGNTPALVTTGSLASAGILNAPGTAVLFGGTGTTAQDSFGGGRFTLGWWCDPSEDKSLEFTYLYLGQGTTRFASGPPLGGAVLARPFFSLNSLTEFSKIVAAPGVASGGVIVDAPSSFMGAELNYRCNLCRGDFSRFDLLAGVRYLELDESIVIADAVIPVGGGASTLTTDSFETSNRFAGGQLGLQWACQGARWSLDLRSKLALGKTRSSTPIQGSQLADGATEPGGLLALASNSGRFEQSRFGVVPEFGLNIGYQCTDNLRLTVGYTLIFWNSVLRPGDQIDRVLDTTLIPNTPQPGVAAAGRTRPAVPLKASDFFVQGMNFGLEYRY